MLDLQDMCHIACYSQCDNPTIFQYALMQVKDKLLEDIFFGYLFFAMLECFLFCANLLNINHMHPCISKYLYNTVIHPSYFVYLFQIDGKHVSYQIIYHNLEGVETKPWPHCKLAAQICSRSRSVRCFGSEATNFETMHHDRFWEHSNPRL